MQTETSTATDAVSTTPLPWGVEASNRKPSRQRLRSSRDCAQLLARYVRKFIDNKCKSEDLSRLAHTLTSLAKLLENQELLERVEALEAAQAATKQPQRRAA